MTQPTWISILYIEAHFPPFQIKKWNIRNVLQPAAVTLKCHLPSTVQSYYKAPALTDQRDKHKSIETDGIHGGKVRLGSVSQEGISGVKWQRGEVLVCDMCMGFYSRRSRVKSSIWEKSFWNRVPLVPRVRINTTKQCFSFMQQTNNKYFIPLFE